MSLTIFPSRVDSQDVASNQEILVQNIKVVRPNNGDKFNDLLAPSNGIASNGQGDKKDEGTKADTVDVNDACGNLRGKADRSEGHDVEIDPIVDGNKTGKGQTQDLTPTGLRNGREFERIPTGQEDGNTFPMTPERPGSFFNVGNTVVVNGGILTVAPELLANNPCSAVQTPEESPNASPGKITERGFFFIAAEHGTDPAAVLE